ncbi:GntR family transcriptional regulator [Streptomyces sp. IB2014 016-6]|uniref:GntR family transcriptional regulator n=1 Tax=Streptomyces sp. IB2014 016-6 TaxID=2517818 RepID=UPI0011C99643|nr:GntR family transcriptional regulator [Streptomyces sp. IB2014 016-6]TXL90831.1 GntR family transcriptional regulator [Streptomyces sp. IB2014 016-6]
MTAGGLSIRVDSGAPVPPFEQIRRQLADLISVGRLREGDRLPPVRQLASDLGLANNTVVRAYRELESAGLVHSRRGSGTRVAAAAGAVDDHARAKLAERARDFVTAARLLGTSDEDALAAVRHALASGEGT